MGQRRQPSSASVSLTGSGSRARPAPRHAQASFGEERLWFLHRLEPEASTYNLPFAFELRGPIDLTALQESIDILASRHDTLSSIYRRSRTALRRTVQSAGPRLDVVDLTSVPLHQRRADAVELATRLARAPFDLARGPLLRIAVAALADDHHLLVVVFHHIVVDEWSLAIFFDELSRLYEARLRRRAVDLPDLPLRYGDYAAEQRARVDAGEAGGDVEYWLDHLRDCDLVLRLPLARPRSPGRVTAADCRFGLPADLAEDIRAFAIGEGTTLFTIGLSLFAILIRAYSGRDDFVVAAPAAGRMRIELERVVGLFLNTLPLRFRLDGDKSFRDVVLDTHKTLLEGLEHQEFPFERLVALLNPERNASHLPVAQVSFTTRAANDVELVLPGVVVDVLPLETATAKFDLSLFLTDDGDSGITGLVEYRPDLFTKEAVERFARHYGPLAAWAVRFPSAPIRNAVLATEDERRQVRRSATGPTQTISAEGFLGQLADVSDRFRSSVAVTSEAGSLTYSELAAESDAVAEALRQRGFGTGSRVALSEGRSPTLLVGLLGILKAGAAYVPIDPGTTATRRELILRDADVAAAVVDEESFVAFDGLDRIVPPVPSDRAARERTYPGPDDPAYVIYTSGSTGAPKGVEVSHGNLGNYVAAVLQRLQVRAGARWAMLSPVWTDLGHTVLFGALATGGTLVIAADETVRRVDELASFLARSKVDVAKLVPGLARALLATDPMGSFLPREHLVLGGETFTWQLYRSIVGTGASCRVFNHYGPTEATVGALCSEVDPDAPSETVPLGRPLANVVAYVLDGDLHPTPMGVPGELCIGGAGVARGYVGYAELTTERFVQAPFEPGLRLYRTGDRARVFGGGSFEFLGRLDDEVKVSGFRVNPLEVEAAIRALSTVEDAAVIAERTRDGSERLVAYVVGNASAEQVRAGLRRDLPDHLVPARIVSIDRLPLGTAGKVDRSALLETRDVGSGEDRAAATTVEQSQVLSIWQDLLGSASIGVDDDFFDVGGHSLLAAHLGARIRATLGVDLPLRTLFERRTVRDQAEVVAGLGGAGAPEPTTR